MHLRFFQQCSLEPWKTDLRDGVWGSISTSPWHHGIKIIQHRHKLAVLFVPFYGRTSRWFIDYLTCWCVVVCLPLWRSPIVQNLVTFTDPCQGRYSDLPFKCAKSPNPFGPTLKESDIPPPVRHSTLERSCPCEKGSRCLNPNNSDSQIQIYLKDASFRCNTKNSLSRGGTGKVSHTQTSRTRIGDRCHQHSKSYQKTIQSNPAWRMACGANATPELPKTTKPNHEPFQFSTHQEPSNDGSFTADQPHS